MGVKCRKKTGQSLLSFNFKYIPKAERSGFLGFFLNCFAKFGGKKRVENHALVNVGWRQECFFFFFFYLPVFTGEVLRQNSKAMAALAAACRQEEQSPPQILFPGTNKISTEDTRLSQQCRCHQMSALFQCMNQSGEVSEPHILHLLIRVQLPPRKQNTVKSHYPACREHL